MIRENVPLAPFTSFDIGGPARYFTDAVDTEVFIGALRFACDKNVPWYLLGAGTNVLVNDSGFPGLIIRTKPEGFWIENGRVMAGSGVMLSSVVRKAAAVGLSGLERLAGVPGTVGGAVRGNAGAFGCAIGDLVEKVLVLDTRTLESRWHEGEQCRFAYRGSMFKDDRNLIVVMVRLSLTTDHPEEIRRRGEQILMRRSAALEKEKSVGSYFMNPVTSDPTLVREFERDRHTVCRNCTIPAGWFIDRAGLRGATVGGAMVSPLHGNYLINTGTATADDVLRLARLVKERVREKLGVELKEEVNYVGFE